jgi:citrate synthase
MKWMESNAACAALGVKPASLYAYVSRGLVRARTAEKDPRASLYAAADIEQLLTRKRAGRKRDSIARGAIGWGEPILESAIATVREGRLIFRGHDAVVLSQTKTLEEVASLLWGAEGLPAVAPSHQLIVEADSKAAGLRHLATMAATQPPCAGRSVGDLSHDAATLLEGLSYAMSMGAQGTHAHSRLANLWNLTATQADGVRRALVLLADHELNPSTFAARVAASTGASLAAAALAGFTTLTGPFHGEAAAGALAFLRRARDEGAGVAVQHDHAVQKNLPGLGHQLYPDGDPRARALLQALNLDPKLAEAIQLAEKKWGALANIDMALAALTLQFELPAQAPFTLFAVARMAGWLAHGAEQGLSGAPIRPRARYVGQSG